MIRLLSAILVFTTVQFSYGQVSDTLGYAKYLQGSDTLYTSPNGGYAFGNNGYNDWVKAESYSDTDNVVLREVLMLFGHVSFGSQDSTSVVRVTVYLNDGFGVTSIGTSDSIAPDSIVAFVDIPVYQLLDNGSFTVADFTSQTIVLRSRFSIGIDLRYLSVGDTVGLMSTTDGDAGGTYNAWELASSNNWFTVESSVYSWGLDVDLALFPTIDRYDPASVSRYEEVDLIAYPNPVIDMVSLQFPDNERWSISVLDVFGKVVCQTQRITQSTTLDMSGFSCGTYVVHAESNSRTATKLIVKR